MAQRKNSGRTFQRAGTENRNASATKSGPGRFHVAGHSKATPPKSYGVGSDFVLHKASKDKRERRELVKNYGRRQALKAIKFWRADAKFNASLEDGSDDALSTRHHESVEVNAA